MSKGKALKVPAVLYARESADESYSRGTSISGQKRAAYGWAERNGYLVIREYVDEHLKGWDHAGRKALKQLLRDAESKQRDFEAVILWDHTRFSRDAGKGITLADELDDLGIELISVKEGGRVNRLVRNISFALGDEQRRIMGRDILRGNINSTSMGFAPGGAPPYGLKKVAVEWGKGFKKKFAPDPNEAYWVQWIYDRFTKDHWSPYRIAAELNRQGVAGRNGGTWVGSNVRTILTRHRPLYCGHIVYNRERVKKRSGKSRIVTIKDASEIVIAKDCHEPIISQEVAEAAERELKRRKRGQVMRKRNHLLLGLLKCASCGSTYTTKYQGKSDSSGKEYIYYACQGPAYAKQRGEDPVCRPPMLPKERTEAAVKLAIFDVLFAPDLLAILEDEYRKLDENREKVTAPEVDRLKREIRRLETGRANILDSIEKGLSWELAKDRVESLQRNLQNARQELQTLQSIDPEEQEDREEFFSALRDLEGLREVAETDFETAREVLLTVVDSIEVDGKRLTVRFRMPLTPLEIILH